MVFILAKEHGIKHVHSKYGVISLARYIGYNKNYILICVASNTSH